jgi:hypothetical protein
MLTWKHTFQRPDNLHTIRTGGELDLPDGKTSAHMSLLQNDHAAEYDKFKGKAGKEVYVTEGMQGEHSAIPIENIEIAGSHTDGFTVMDATTGQSFEEFLTREAAQQHIKEHLGENPKIPEPIMLNTWWKHGLKASIKDAVKSGHDYFTWDPAETQMKRFAGAGEDVAQYMKNHYDNNIPGFLKKEYGVEAKKVDLSAGKNDPTGRVRHVNFPDEHGIPPQDLSIERNHEGGYSFVYQPFNSMFEGSWNRFPSRQAANQFMESRITEAPMKLEKKEVWQIPITEEIKKKVAEGQFWSKAAKPGGNHAESVA